MSPEIWIPVAVVGGALLLVSIWIVATINRFIRLGNLIKESWSNVDVALKRRYDLIPNLVETVRGYAQHERETLDQVVAARDAAAAPHNRIDDQAGDENRLVREVNRLLARVEAYPALKASHNFLALQRELTDTEDRIAAARRFYNANVREHNTLRDQFPTLVIARLMNRQPSDFFEVEELAIRQAPRVAL